MIQKVKKMCEIKIDNFEFCRLSDCLLIQSKTIQTPLTTPRRSNPKPTPLSTATLGASFPTLLCPDTVAVQEAPQTNPLGQQPPPSACPQPYHPLAQFPLGPVVLLGGEDPPGVVVDVYVITPTEVAPLPPATIVRPLLTTTEVLASAGQDVVSQFLPTRQQPPR